MILQLIARKPALTRRAFCWVGFDSNALPCFDWEMTDPLDSVAASQLATAAILAALVATLARKGVLTDREVKETYESALLMIEEGQGTSPEAELVFAAARDLIEEHLRSSGEPPAAE